MGTGNFVLSYVQECASGTLSFSDCSPFWQLGIIAILLGLLVSLALIITRPVRKATQ